MMTQPPRTRVIPLAVLMATLLLILVSPVGVLGHAELVTSDPKAESTVTGPFAGPIVMTFSETLAPTSGAEVLDGSGKLPSTTVVDAMTMTLTPDAALAEGDYEIQWKSIADDGHILRGTFTFTVAPAPTPSPTASPTPTPSATASAAASASAAAPSATAAASATPAPIPTAAPGGSGGSSSGSDVILPIVAAVVILGGLAAYLLRRRDSGTAAS